MQPLPNARHKQPELLDIIQRGRPILDVRAPIEFKQGQLPNSHNFAILNDEERAAVGTLYKNQGHEAAVALGHELVSGQVKTDRVATWCDLINTQPDTLVMCWRGGQRSRLAQSWIAAEGIQAERVPGGYKAMRQLCLSLIEDASADAKPWWVIAGRTGVQKTVLIQSLACSIDLEHMAHHRGSAFGGYPTPQPSVASFENQLAYAALNHQHKILVLEDESRAIGSVGLPASWHTRMKSSPLVLVEASLEARVEHIVEEYVTQAGRLGENKHDLEIRYRGALGRIKRRLGGELHQHIDTLLANAFSGKGSHQAWVYALLRDYYDPMYDYQLKNKQARIQFTGHLTEVREFLAAKC